MTNPLQKIRLPPRRSIRQLIPRNKLPLHSFFRHNRRSQRPATTPIPRHRVRHSLLHQRRRIFLIHILSKTTIHQTVNIRRSRPSNRERHFDTGTAEGNVVDASSVDGIPSANNDAGEEIVFVFVAEFSHEAGCYFHRGLSTRFDTDLTQIMLHVIGQSLSIRSTPTATTKNPIVKLHNFICGTIGNVSTRGDPSVGPEDDATREGDGHDGGSRGDFPRFETRVVVGDCGLGKMGILLVVIHCFR
mmetsp:Transcript_41383/g.50332  ORF Transcript_41383/g.50332 Transcript_41383/m.50332 type:complete len:245 (-) Transcript_41383:154-888(-)